MYNPTYMVLALTIRSRNFLLYRFRDRAFSAVLVRGIPHMQIYIYIYVYMYICIYIEWRNRCASTPIHTSTPQAPLVSIIRIALGRANILTTVRWRAGAGEPAPSSPSSRPATSRNEYHYKCTNCSNSNMSVIFTTLTVELCHRSPQHGAPISYIGMIAKMMHPIGMRHTHRSQSSAIE